MARTRFSRTASLGYLVNHAARLLERALAQEIGPHGAWPAYFPVLLALWEADGRTQAELVQLVDVEQPTLANTLRRMERDELVHRTPDPTDRRAARIHLTARGRVLEETLTQEARGVNERALRGLDAAQRAALLTALRQVIDNLHRSHG
jgi:DNA-binding MarR family transcriptional regulator